PLHAGGQTHSRNTDRSTDDHHRRRATISFADEKNLTPSAVGQILYDFLEIFDGMRTVLRRRQKLRPAACTKCHSEAPYNSPTMIRRRKSGADVSFHRLRKPGRVFSVRC